MAVCGSGRLYVFLFDPVTDQNCLFAFRVAYIYLFIVSSLEFVQMLQPPIPIPPEQMEAERKKLEEEMKKKEKILAQVRINIVYANN